MQQVVEAIRSMHRSKSFGYIAYPILVLLFLFAPEMVSVSLAQSTTDAAPDPAQPPAPATAPQPLPQSSSQQPPAGSTPQDAAARIRARRQQRIAQAISDIYDHKYEVVGGGGFLRFRPGHSLQNVSEVMWNAGITDYIRPRLGVTLDLRGQYGTAYTYNNPFLIYAPSLWQYTGMIGPQYRIHKGQRYAASARVLAGMTYGSFDGGENGNPPARFLGLYSNGSSPAFGVGLPLDYNLSPGLGVRLTPEYFLTRFGGEFQRNKGFTLGVIYRFGHQ